MVNSRSSLLCRATATMITVVDLRRHCNPAHSFAYPIDRRFVAPGGNNEQAVCRQGSGLGFFIIAVGSLVSLGLGGGQASGAAPPQQDAQICGAQWNFFPGAEMGTVEGSLSSVATISPNNVWAVEGSLIEHWDGQVWSRVPGHGILHAVAAAGPENIWAVGVNTVRRWDGTAWQDVPVVISPTEEQTYTYELFGLAVASANDAWAVGNFRYGPARFGYTTRALALPVGRSTGGNPVPMPADAPNPLRAVTLPAPTRPGPSAGRPSCTGTAPPGALYPARPSPTSTSPAWSRSLLFLSTTYRQSG